MILQPQFALSGQAPSAFIYYSPLTVQAGQVPSTQTDFPILINVTDARFKTVGNGGHVQNANGYDIRPFSDSGITSALTYELEFYDGTNGIVVMWVKRSSLDDANVTYLAYGNPTLTIDGSSTATWSNGFFGVYHLADGTTLNLNDSTSANNLTNNNGVTATIGQIDGGGGFASASSQALDKALAAGPGIAFTLSAWVKATSFPNSYNAIIGYIAGVGHTMDLFVKSNGKLACYLQATAQVSYDGTGSNTLSTGTWYYITMTYSTSDGLKGKVNASSDGTAAANGDSESQLHIVIGDDPLTTGRNWNGVIDEPRIATVVRSDDWITTEYNNQSAPGTFMVLGAEV